MSITEQATIKKYGSNFSHDYIEECFYQWYSRGRISSPDLIVQIGADYRGDKPTSVTINNWKKEYGWEERADEMDIVVREKVQRQYILEKAKMLSKHAELGRTLQEKGLDFLRSHEITSQHAAIRAIEAGIMIEKDSTNLEKLMESVTRMDDAKLTRKMDVLLSKVSLHEEDRESNIDETS
jgi:hypothetical protein